MPFPVLQPILTFGSICSSLRSDEVVEMLLSHWSAPEYTSPTAFFPLLLSFDRVHALATKFFLRIWQESNAIFPADFGRIGLVVRSQIAIVLQDEDKTALKGGRSSGRNGWLEIEEGFEQEYTDIKKRLVKEAEERDDVLSKPSIR